MVMEAQVFKNKRTPIGKFIHNSWTNLQIRCGKYKHLNTKLKNKNYKNISIEFSFSEYKNYCIENKEYILSLKRPSLDRINNKNNYSINNIQIIELSENIIKDKTVFKYNKGICSKCKIEKELHLFCIDKRRISGRSSICKHCDNKRKRD